MYYGVSVTYFSNSAFGVGLRFAQQVVEGSPTNRELSTSKTSLSVEVMCWFSVKWRALVPR
jgi:hypothetical protein